MSLLDQITNYIEETSRSGFYKIVSKMYSAIMETRKGLEELAPILKVDYTDTDKPVFEFVIDLYEILTPLAITFLIIWLLIEVSRVYAFEREDMTLRSAFAPLLKFVFGYALIAYGREFISIALDINNAVVDLFSDSANLREFSEVQGQVDAIVNSVNELNWGEVIGSMMNGVIIELAVTIAMGMMVFHCYSRKIEILLRLPFVGLALSDVYEGKNSTGVRYMKKVLALAVSGLAIVVTLKIGTSLMVGESSESIVGKPLSQAISPVLIAFAMSGMVSTAKQIANDVFGV